MKKSPLFKYIMVSTAIFLAIICFFKHDNIFRWISYGFTVREQRRQIEWYHREISSLDRQIGDMSTDRDTLEKIAREKFYFSEPGDDVFIIGK